MTRSAECLSLCLTLCLVALTSSLGRHAGQAASELCEVNSRTKVCHLTPSTTLTAGLDWGGLPCSWAGAVQHLLQDDERL